MAKDENIKTWHQITTRLRQRLGFNAPTLEEAEVEMAEAGEVPISESDIERMVATVARRTAKKD